MTKYVLARSTLCKCFDYDMEREYVRLTNLYIDIDMVIWSTSLEWMTKHVLVGTNFFSSPKLEFSYFPTLLLFSQVGEEASWQK